MRHAYAFAFGAIVLAGACGREEVVLVAAETDAGSDATTLGDGASSSGGACTDASTHACRGLGEGCVAELDCCSGRCESGACLPLACGAAGAACTTRDACCSSRCEPVSGTSNRACLEYCAAIGAACANAQDCCSLECLGGVCSTGLCGKTGDECNANGDCCSGRCTTGRCELDTALSCRPTGEDCNSGGGVGCCATCNKDQRCDLGPGACRASGAPCTAPTDCCGGECTADAAGHLVCSAACAAESSACVTSADCCAGSCSGDPPVCHPAAIACELLGDTCATDAECCSEQCLSGRCGDNCARLH